jgi:hypothetical protein
MMILSMPAQTQTQPGSAKAPRRRAIRLRERLEDLRLLGCRDPDAGVPDREMQLIVRISGFDAQDDLPPVRELELALRLGGLQRLAPRGAQIRLDAMPLPRPCEA